MTLRRCSLSAFCVIVSVSLFPGCDPDWAKKLDTGEVVPNFSFKLTSKQPIDKSELHIRFREVAQNAGYTRFLGDPTIERTIEGTEENLGFDWAKELSSGAPQYRIRLWWREQPGPAAREFTMKFYNKDMNDFEVQEWSEFRKWRDEILPSAFPGATIRVTRHPADYTAQELWQPYSIQSNVEPPKEVKKLQ